MFFIKKAGKNRIILNNQLVTVKKPAFFVINDEW